MSPIKKADRYAGVENTIDTSEHDGCALIVRHAVQRDDDVVVTFHGNCRCADRHLRGIEDLHGHATGRNGPVKLKHNFVRAAPWFDREWIVDTAIDEDFIIASTVLLA